MVRRVAGRLRRAYSALPHERRLAAGAAFALVVTLFLPWYQQTVIATGRGALESRTVSITGWGAFSFVEAAVLLVAGAVLTLLFQRAEGRAFHLPGGDGWVITAAGVWTSLLVVWRMFDKQTTSVRGPGATTTGIEWGIFVALGVAALLAYTGSRIRAAHTPEPALPGDDANPEPAPCGPDDPAGGPGAAAGAEAASRRVPGVSAAPPATSEGQRPASPRRRPPIDVGGDQGAVPAPSPAAVRHQAGSPRLAALVREVRERSAPPAPGEAETIPFTGPGEGG